MKTALPACACKPRQTFSQQEQCCRSRQHGFFCLIPVILHWPVSCQITRYWKIVTKVKRHIITIKSCNKYTCQQLYRNYIFYFYNSLLTSIFYYHPFLLCSKFHKLSNKLHNMYVITSMSFSTITFPHNSFTFASFWNRNARCYLQTPFTNCNMKAKEKIYRNIFCWIIIFY